MKNLCLIIGFLFLAVTSRTEAFFDMFVTYGKQNNQIDAIIQKALDTPDQKWKRTLVPVEDNEGEILCAYSPEHENKNNPEHSFALSRFKDNKKTQNTGSSLFSIAKSKAEKLTATVTTHGSEKLKKVKYTCPLLMIPNDENTICYETFLCQQELSDENNPGPVIYQANHYQKHAICWILDFGGGKIRTYQYRVYRRLIQPEEKAYILELFKYMEAQLKNVDV